MYIYQEIIEIIYVTVILCLMRSPVRPRKRSRGHNRIDKKVINNAKINSGFHDQFITQATGYLTTADIVVKTKTKNKTYSVTLI